MTAVQERLDDAANRSLGGPEGVAEPSRSASATPTATPARPRQFRPDIEGLRAIAVVTVVVYHAGLGLPGGYVGVDVFFVISGFLITRQLVRNVGRDGFTALPAFYAGRMRRLLPGAAVVVVATVLAARVWAPVLQVRSIATDAVFTTFYALNYRLAVEGTDYQRLGTSASPLQHFWSLAVEEQFYFVWPLLVALVLAVSGRSARHGRTVLVVVVLVAVVASSLASVQVTASNAPWAYFSLHTRAWELGVGALVALSAERLTRVPRPLAGVLAWVGLVAVVAGAFLFSDATPFPGSAAWLPVGGAALVIAAGCGPRTRVERVLGEPLMQCLGRISYAWYLWHWPMLVLAPYAVGHPLTVLERCAVVWASLVLALVSFFVVEEPARHLRMPGLRWLGGGLALSGTVLAAGVLTVVYAPSTTGSGAVTHIASVSPGSTGKVEVPAIQRVLAAGLRTRAVPANLTPAPADAADSLPPTSRNGCHAGFTATTQGPCVYGDTAATRTLVLFGDSHAEQWLPALDVLGRNRRWKVVSWTKAACPAADLTVVNPALNRTYTECDTWRAATVARIRALRPAMVVVGQSENVASSSVRPNAFAAATTRTMQALRPATKRVVYLGDIPIPNSDLPGCVAGNLGDVRRCSFRLDRAYTYPDRHRAIAPALGRAGIGTVDPAGWFCTQGRDGGCPAVVGNLLVYRNGTHMTVPFSRWLAPVLWPALQQAARASGRS